MSNPAQTAPAFECISGVDIAAKDFTVAIAVSQAKPKLEPKPFSQNEPGFSAFIKRLEATGIAPAYQLVVM